jgi:hypothetical protein
MRLSIFVWRLAMWTGVAEMCTIKGGSWTCRGQEPPIKVLRGGEHLLHSCGE